MTERADLARALSSALDLKLPPIAVVLLDEPPEGVARVERAVPAGCQFWERAAQGPIATVAADHATCAIGMHTHRMPMDGAPATDLGDALAVFAEAGYVRPEEVAGIPQLEAETRCVVYAPLAEAPQDPDLVLLFADSAQGLVLSEAVERVDRGAPPAHGRPACAIVPAVMGSGRAAVSLGCCGARAYLDVLADDTALWALPGARLAEYVRELEVMAKANTMLAGFHRQRRADIEGGATLSVRESLERFQAAAR